jgi:hypothetical protein
MSFLKQTVTPEELRTVLDIFGNAPTTVARSTQLYPVVQTLLRLANQEHPIGAIVPPADGPQEG